MNIEELKTEVTSLNELKERIGNLEEDERKKEIEELKSKVEEMKHKINDKIKELSEKTDEGSKKEVRQRKELLNTVENIENLENDIIENEVEEEREEEGETLSNENNSVLGKTWEWTKKKSSDSLDWLGEQRNDVLDGEKRQTEKWKNILRASGFAITGIGGIALLGVGLYKCIKKLKNGIFGKRKKEKDDTEAKEKSEKKEKGSWWKKGLARVGGILGTSALGTRTYRNWNYLKGKFNDLLGRNLPFDTALTKAESLILNRSEDDGMRKNLGFKFHENTSELEAFHNKVKIDKNRKRIVGLNLDFHNYEELLTAATLINYMKYAYSGLGANDKPFLVYSNFEGGDIGVSLATGTEEGISGSGTTGKIIGGTAGSMLSLIAGMWSGSPKVGLSLAGIGIPSGILIGDCLDGKNTLHQICPTLDSQHSKDLLAAYLNELGCWKKGNQNIESVSKSKIMSDIKKIIIEIEDTDPDNRKNDNRGNERKLDAVEVPGNPEKFKITSYGGMETLVTVNIKDKTLKLDDLNITFPLEEGIRVANFTNMMKKKYSGECGNDDKPFSFKGLTTTAGHPGLYVSLYGDLTPTRILTKEMMKKRFPALLENVEPDYITYLNEMKDQGTNMPLWVSR